MTRNAASPGTTDAENARVARNAKRLLRDAKLLSDHDGHASAFALAVLGLEEIGKVILRIWGLSDHAFSHPHKQLAVSSLLLMDAMFRETQRQAGRGMVLPSKPRRFSGAALGKAVMESEAGRFSQGVDAKMVEKIKQFALYYDGAGIHPDRFTRAHVEAIFEMCSRASSAFENDETVQGAKILFLAKKDVLLSKGRRTKQRRA